MKKIISFVLTTILILSLGSNLVYANTKDSINGLYFNNIKLSDNCIIYKVNLPNKGDNLEAGYYEKITYEDLKTNIGGDALIYRSSNGEADVILVKEKTIKVKIMEGYKGEYSSIKLQSENQYEAYDENNEVLFSFEPNEEYEFKINENNIRVLKSSQPEKYFDYAVSSIYLRPLDYKGNIKVTSIIKDRYRDKFNPKYKGIMEIKITEDKLSLINEVNIEDYVKGVLPSEMFSKFNQEALKAQAVLARTRAYNSYKSNKIIQDNQSYQVYNNKLGLINQHQAVEDTFGQGLQHNGSPIKQALYYSTSCGYGASKEDIYPDYLTTELPGKDKIPYLTAQSYTYDGDIHNKVNIDFSNEEECTRFFKDLSIKTYDNNSKYHRWKIEFTKEDLSEIIKNNINRVSESFYSFIYIKDENGEFTPLSTCCEAYIESERTSAEGAIGTLEDIYVEKRGKGGNVISLIVKGSNNTLKITKEVVIRKIITPKETSDVQVAYNGEQQYHSYGEGVDESNQISILLSAYFSSENSEGKVTLYGGGNGHGLGMSQYGADFLGSNGTAYDEILKIYYPNTEINKIYNINENPYDKESLIMLCNVMNEYIKENRDEKQNVIKVFEEKIENIRSLICSEDENTLNVKKLTDEILDAYNQCLNSEENIIEDIKVTGVILNKESITLNEGKSKILTAEVKPKNAKNKSLTWSTSDEGIAIVNNEGKVSAKGVGDCIIKVISDEGNFAAECEVNVTKKPASPAPAYFPAVRPTIKKVKNVELNKTLLTLKVGSTESLEALITPTNATNKKVKWTSTDDKIAKVNSKGEITSISEGTAKIMATTNDGNYSDECIVVVDNNIYKWKTQEAASKDKIWTIKFNQKLSDKNINDKVFVVDSSGRRIDSNVYVGKDQKSIIVTPPDSKYTRGRKYKLYINKGIESTRDKILEKCIEMEFIIKN